MLTIYDQPDRPLALETFINVEDPQQRGDYAQLARQPDMTLLFYDEQLQHRLSKQIRNAASVAMVQVLTRADTLLASIPRDRFNFEIAKAAVLTQTTL